MVAHHPSACSRNPKTQFIWENILLASIRHITHSPHTTRQSGGRSETASGDGDAGGGNICGRHRPWRIQSEIHRRIDATGVEWGQPGHHRAHNHQLSSVVSSRSEDSHKTLHPTAPCRSVRMAEGEMVAGTGGAAVPLGRGATTQPQSSCCGIHLPRIEASTDTIIGASWACVCVCVCD